MINRDGIYIKPIRLNFKPPEMSNNEWSEYCIAVAAQEISNDIDKKLLDKMCKDLEVKYKD